MKRFLCLILLFGFLVLCGFGWGNKPWGQSPWGVGKFGSGGWGQDGEAATTAGEWTFKDTGGIAFKDTGGISFVDL